MCNPLPELCREGLRMIVLVSLIVLLRRFPCFHDFSHSATSPFIQLNDFCACSTYFFMVCIYANAYMRRLVHAAP